MSGKRLPLAVAFALLVVLAGCLNAPVGGQATPTPTSEPTTPVVTQTGPNGSATVVAPDYTELYRDTIDSVVMLRVSTDTGAVGGSGFVYDGRGHVVTNEHVVAGADMVEVRFHDGEWRTGRVVGTDVYSDLAVVHIADPPDEAEPLPIADSTPRPGERVVALGSPFGLEGSITSGIVSGVNRSMRTENGFSIPDTVQTDAAINPGNSGGPLVSTSGAVVGVNRARGGENVGFAISAAIVERVVPALVREGRFEHPFMGVLTLEVTPTVAEANGLSEPTGLLVVETPSGGPADGVLQPARSETTINGQTFPTDGDVIVAVDGRPIADHQALSRFLVLQTRPGDTLDVTVLRNGSRRTVSFELGTRPSP